MIPKEDSWTIVVAGHWNRMIFSPQWVGEFLYKVEQLDALVGLSPMAPTVYRNEDVSLAVTEQRMALNCRKLTEACVDQAEDLACKTLDELSHTPVSAIGVNFGFVERSPDGTLLQLFSHADEADMVGCGWEVSVKKLVRTLRRGDRTLNLVFAYEKGEVEIDANFHKDVSCAKEAAEAIRGSARRMYESLTGLLETVHGLKLEE